MEVPPELRARLQELEPPPQPRPKVPRKPKPSSTWEMEAMIRLGYRSLREMWADQFPPGSPEGLKRELAKQFGVGVDTIRRCIREAGLSPYERVRRNPKYLPAEASPTPATSTASAEPARPAERREPPQACVPAPQTAPPPRRRTAEATLAIIRECVPRSALNLADLAHMQRRAAKLSDEELRAWLRRQFQR
jgi:hypothetical protein